MNPSVVLYFIMRCLEDNEVRMKKVEDNIVNHVSPLRVGRSGHGRDIAAVGSDLFELVPVRSYTCLDRSLPCF